MVLGSCVHRGRNPSLYKTMTATKLTCLFCKQSFTNPKNYKAIYCSNRCRFDAMPQKVTVNCQRCSKSILVVHSLANKTKFCSKDCRYVPVFKKCLRCEKDFQIKNCEIKRKKFCSYACAYPKERRFKKVCPNCNKEFIVTNADLIQVHCSRACQKQTTEKKRAIKTCLGCDKEFTVKKKYLNETAKHCSRKCRIRTTLKICALCKVEYFPGAAYAENSKFCSNKCRFDKFNKAQKRIAKNPHLKWCSAGKHTFASISNKRSSCNDCRKIDTQIRQLRARHAKGSFTFEQWREKIKLWGNRCYLCSESLIDKKVHIEHRIPISRGGSNWIANIAPACAPCNMSKHAKTEKEFREWQKLRV